MDDLSKHSAEGEWLSPTEALNRFKLSAEDFVGDKTVKTDPKRYGVRIGSISVLLPQDTVSEILDRTVIYPIPNTAPFLEGLINLRGNLVPVFDLRDLLDTETDPDRKQMLLVIDKGDNALGLAVDGLPESSSASTPLKQLPPLPGVLREFVKAAYLDDGNVWLDTDLSGFVRSLAQQLSV